jgi:hypothetical protein
MDRGCVQEEGAVGTARTASHSPGHAEDHAVAQDADTLTRMSMRL